MNKEFFYSGKKFRAYCPKCEKNRTFIVIDECDAIHAKDATFPFMVKSIVCGKCGSEMTVLPEEVFAANEASKNEAFKLAEKSGQF